MIDPQSTEITQLANQFETEALAGDGSADARTLKGLALLLECQRRQLKVMMETQTHLKAINSRLGWILLIILGVIGLQFLAAFLSLF